MTSDMTHEELVRAAELLETAADDASGDASERLAEQARQLASLAERDRRPDHGRLDRHQQALRDLAGIVEEDTAERIEDAIGLISKYRESVPGV